MATTVGKPKTAKIHPGPGFRMRSNTVPSKWAAIEALGRFETPAISYLITASTRWTGHPEPLGSRAPNARARLHGDAVSQPQSDGAQGPRHRASRRSRGRRQRGIGQHGRPRDLVSAKARHRGVAGFVVDRMIRDLPGVQRLNDFPVFARGVTPVAPCTVGPGRPTIRSRSKGSPSSPATSSSVT
jgi:hypothetical protein